MVSKAIGSVRGQIVKFFAKLITCMQQLLTRVTPLNKRATNLEELLTQKPWKPLTIVLVAYE